VAFRLAGDKVTGALRAGVLRAAGGLGQSRRDYCAARYEHHHPELRNATVQFVGDGRVPPSSVTRAGWTLKASSRSALARATSAAAISGGGRSVNVIPIFPGARGTLG
jgi:hypothetical protein